MRPNQLRVALQPDTGLQCADRLCTKSAFLMNRILHSRHGSRDPDAAFLPAVSVPKILIQFQVQRAVAVYKSRYNLNCHKRAYYSTTCDVIWVDVTRREGKESLSVEKRFQRPTSNYEGCAVIFQCSNVHVATCNLLCSSLQLLEAHKYKLYSVTLLYLVACWGTHVRAYCTKVVSTCGCLLKIRWQCPVLAVAAPAWDPWGAASGDSDKGGLQRPLYVSTLDPCRARDQISPIVSPGKPVRTWQPGLYPYLLYSRPVPNFVRTSPHPDPAQACPSLPTHGSILQFLIIDYLHPALRLYQF